MDQLVSARAQARHALLIDCRSLECRPVPMPEGLAVIVIHSRIERGLVDSAYNERRRQCEQAARHYGVAALRDLDEAALEAGREGLDPLTFRRARHVVTENARTLAAADALAAGDLARLGVLMAQSHASMRDDFEITLPAIDRLVEIAAEAIGSDGGARMTGGGFGGCIVALAPEGAVERVQEAVARDYRSPDGKEAHFMVCRPSAGAGPV
jgi:galactokinase